MFKVYRMLDISPVIKKLFSALNDNYNIRQSFQFAKLNVGGVYHGTITIRLENLEFYSRRSSKDTVAKCF